MYVANYEKHQKLRHESYLKIQILEMKYHPLLPSQDSKVQLSSE